MSIPGQEAVARFLENEARLHDFVNNATKYVDSNGNDVESLPHLITRLNIGGIDGTTLSLGTAAGLATINIGTGPSANVINIGASGDTVNIAGSLAYVNVTNMNVTDKLITLNKGGAAASGEGSGIEIEENSVIAGRIKLANSRQSWLFTVPGKSGAILLTPSASAFNAEILGSNTAARTYTLPDASGTFWLKDTALTATSGTFANILITNENLQIKRTSGNCEFSIISIAGTTRTIFFYSGGASAPSARWGLQVNGAAESGSNVGSDLVLLAYSDAGALIDTILTIKRAAGTNLVSKRPIEIDANGTSGGIYLKNPSGVRYRLSINASNQLQLDQA